MTQCSFKSRTVLNRPYTHVYGQQEPVSGDIHLECEPPRSDNSIENCEVLLDVHANLWGHAESSIWIDSRRKRLLHSADVQLFSEKSIILRQNLEIRQKRNFTIPFSVTFPRTTQAHLRSLLWQDGAKEIYEGNPEHPLPPSTFARSSYAAFPFLAVVEYFVDTCFTVRRSDNTTVQSDCAEPTRIYYEGCQLGTGSIPRSMQIHKTRIDMSDIGLIQRLGQVKGFRAKARSVVLSAPHDKASIKVNCHIPRQLWIGDAITCVVSLGSIQDQHQDNTGIPTLYLTSATLHLYETIHVRTERLAGNMPESIEQTGLIGLAFVLDPCEPFDAATRNTKTISTRKLREIPVSFATHNIARSFHAVFAIRIESEKWSGNVEIEQPVRVCSGNIPRNATLPYRRFQQSTSQSSCNMYVDAVHSQPAASDEGLPSYQEAITQP